MVTVKIDEDVLLDMLDTRLNEWWNPSDIAAELFHDYYESLVYSGAFEGIELDVSAIVDNDWVNNLSVIDETEFDNYSIEDEEDDRIILSKEDHNGTKWFLVYN